MAAKLYKQQQKIAEEIDIAADTYNRLGFAPPALEDIPAIGPNTPVALSSLVPVDGSTEADESPPVQHSMQSIIGMLVTCKRSGETSKILEQKLKTALQKYDRGRTAQTKVLVPLIIDDIADYKAHLDEVLADSPDAAAITKRLKMLARQTRPNVEDAEADPRMPDPRTPEFVVYGRWLAARSSLDLYTNICIVVNRLGIPGIVVLPGGVKREPRIVMKTFLKYRGDFSLVQDMSRITVVVDTLEQVADVVEAIQKSGYFVIVRCKNRWDPAMAVLAEGGYRDFQIQARMQLADGRWTSNEIQVNLRGFMALKDGKKGGGHGAFDLARIIQAFSPETVIYTGRPSPALWLNVAAGMYLELEFAASELTVANMAGATDAVAADNCRLNAVSFSACAASMPTLEVYPTFMGGAIAAMVSGCSSLRRLDLTSTKLAATRIIAAAVATSMSLANDGVIDPAGEVVNHIDAARAKIGALAAVFQFDVIVASRMSQRGLWIGDTEWILYHRLDASDCDWIAAALPICNGSKMLTKLSLESGTIGSTGAATLAAVLPQCMELAEFSLVNNDIGDTGVSSLLAALVQLKGLRLVDLSMNKIGDAGALELAATVPKCKMLNSANLGGNQFTTAGWMALIVNNSARAAVCLGAVCQGTFNGKSLTLAAPTDHFGRPTPKVKYIKITDADCIWIAAVLRQCTVLEDVNLSGNAIADAGASELAAAIPKCKALLNLRLDVNQIGNEGASVLASAFPECQALKAINLNHNKIADDGAAALATALPTCKSLRKFSMTHNDIEDAGKASLAEAQRQDRESHPEDRRMHSDSHRVNVSYKPTAADEAARRAAEAARR